VTCEERGGHFLNAGWRATSDKMSDAKDLVIKALQLLGQKPSDAASRSAKKSYSERMSQVLAVALSQGFRDRGLKEMRPAAPGVLGGSGAERRLSGGLGAKKVDVSWATEESGLLFGVSIKTINFRDPKTKNFQKNLTNRRGDMLFEAVTLHQRFPYSVLVGLLCLDAGAETDGTFKRRSTFLNAHPRLKLFTGRSDPAGRNEQFERFFVALVNAEVDPPSLRLFQIGDPDAEVSLDFFFAESMAIVAERNPDFYQIVDGQMVGAD
jgi:hypothetical protein